ncbi:amidohydrolase family protein [Salipiger sp. PrR007]|uniref:amidohydrolase family protein n=1 Tax=Salipiger sp. PrR007 TaxID=2706884 RepID=UPI0013B68172|nr:amidohydrolase family protein [Salipiger sp. PrR007]NDW34179.1 amidohydrolase family protein [Salipiger sp. PrR007]
MKGTRDALPGRSRILGDARSFRPEVSAEIARQAHAIVAGIAAAHGVTAEVDYSREFVPLGNDAALATAHEAAHRAISHAELVDVPVVIVPISGRDPMEQIQWAKRRGLNVFAETCPQYIALTKDDLKGLNMDFEGAKYVCSPPPRDHDSQEAIWQGLRDGTFDLFSEGVSKGRISLERFVALTSSNPAKLYSMYPQKGALVIGAEADITLWEPERRAVVRQERMHHGADYTPYEGMEITGWPVRTGYAASEGVVQDALGQYLARETSQRRF